MKTNQNKEHSAKFCRRESKNSGSGNASTSYLKKTTAVIFDRTFFLSRQKSIYICAIIKNITLSK